MKDIYLINYTVSGIKSIDKPVTLSFYKKTISNNFDIKNYNVKGIYGMNGSGKTGIVTSVDILRRTLLDSSYLSNKIAQKELDEIINKKTKKLSIEADFVDLGNPKLFFFKYSITISQNTLGKYVISSEKMSVKSNSSKSGGLIPVFESKDGNFVTDTIKINDEFVDILIPYTINLMSTRSICTVFVEQILRTALPKGVPNASYLFLALMSLLFFGVSLNVHLEGSDNHKDHIIRNTLAYGQNDSNDASLVEQLVKLDNITSNDISVTNNFINKKLYNQFEKNIEQLYKFLRIFKPELKSIEIDKKEDENSYICSLLMNYDSYKIHAEYESTGIKKLIKLFTHINAMAQGDIVFIDEFDSNLHDVYLCALLEYLMEYGKGQLCFTTHNVGPMDVLKKNKKSIDFLSTDNRVYPWKTNGNYSPSKLYRNGMIEGSPFNVDSIDFISVFDTGEEDD